MPILQFDDGTQLTDLDAITHELQLLQIRF